MTRNFDICFTRLLVFTLRTFCLLGAPAAANQKDLKEEELKTLQAKIKKLKQTIDVKEDSKSRYTAQLEKIERKVGAISRKIRDNEKKIGQKQHALKKVSKNRTKQPKTLSPNTELHATQA